MSSYFNFQWPIAISEAGKVALCETTHQKFHEKYNEFQGDQGGYIGEVWESGIRCTKCGRKWDDPERIRAANLQWQWDHMQEWDCEMGTHDEIIFGLHGKFTGYGIRSLEEEYVEIREMLLNKDYPDGDPYGNPEPSRDIGPIEDKFFVFADAGTGEQWQVPSTRGFAKNGIETFSTWNLFSN